MEVVAASLELLVFGAREHHNHVAGVPVGLHVLCYMHSITQIYGADACCSDDKLITYQFISDNSRTYDILRITLYIVIQSYSYADLLLMCIIFDSTGKAMQ